MQRFWGMGTTAKFPFTLKTIQGRKRWKQPFGRTVQNLFVLKEVFGFLSPELLKLNIRTIKALLVILLFLGGAKVFAQNHVNWTFSFNAPTSEIYVKGDIEEHWHLYSNKTPQNAGPVPIEIHLAKSKAYKIKKDFQSNRFLQKYLIQILKVLFLFLRMNLNQQLKLKLEVKEMLLLKALLLTWYAMRQCVFHPLTNLSKLI